MQPEVPFSGDLRALRKWAKENGGTCRVVHKNPRGVVEIVYKDYRILYHYDKYGKRDGLYSCGSTMPVNFISYFTSRVDTGAMYGEE